MDQRKRIARHVKIEMIGIRLKTALSNMTLLRNNEMILAACLAIVDERLLDDVERQLVENVYPLSEIEAEEVRRAIRNGGDPLGEAFMNANTSEERRGGGETYTPIAMVESMVEIAREMGVPNRVVDVGCGSGRFAIACANAFPQANIVAIDVSPVATLMTKTAICALGFQNRVSVLRGDFTTIELPDYEQSGPTLWIGNPPYVRHHDIPASSKRWLAKSAEQLGLSASGLSGMHAYFVLSIATRLHDGDFGVLVTSAEWLDVKYGSIVRNLLLQRLGLTSLELHDRTKRVFTGIDTTALIFSFNTRRFNELECESPVKVIAGEGMATEIPIGKFKQSEKWTSLMEGHPPADAPEGFVRLGEFARVHRGIVTGANKFWVRNALEDPDGSLTIPVVSHAREIMTGATELQSDGLSRLIALPQDLEALDENEAAQARELIAEGRSLGVDKGYVAQSRKCWWSIPIGDGATILMTYMARRSPVFIANPMRIRSLNVVHGIYPFVELSDSAISGLVEYLNSSVTRSEGRTYCGGLTKFEPREVENIWVPSPTMLEEGSWRS